MPSTVPSKPGTSTQGLPFSCTTRIIYSPRFRAEVCLSIFISFVNNTSKITIRDGFRLSSFFFLLSLLHSHSHSHFALCRISILALIAFAVAFATYCIRVFLMRQPMSMIMIAVTFETSRLRHHPSYIIHHRHASKSCAVCTPSQSQPVPR